MFSQAQLDDLRQRADLVDYVSRHVALTRAGQSWLGLCPFHVEKTPSLSVRAQPPTFLCFGCGARGDIFAFVMRREGLSFPHAVARVAEAFGLTLPPNGRGNNGGDDELIDVLRVAAHHYEANLWSTRGKAARDYLKGRGLTRSTLERMIAGAALDSGDDLLARVAPRFGPRLLQRAGLAFLRAGRPSHDRLRNRVVLPIHDERSRIVAFGARSIDETAPKYINSPSSELYQKSRLLYGLPWAVDAARAAGRIVLVEGYLDAASALQAGVPETLALCGTSFTAHQARLVRRLASRVLLCLDQDAAGLQGVRRALRLLLQEPLDVRIVTLPDGHDADNHIRIAGSEALHRILDAAVPAMQWLINRSAELHDAGSPQGKAAFLAALLPYLIHIQAPVERAAWLQVAVRAAALDEGAAREQLARAMDRRLHRPVGRRVTEFVWASRYGDHGTPLADGLEHHGWTRVAAHPWYADVWLLERSAERPLVTQRP